MPKSLEGAALEQLSMKSVGNGVQDTIDRAADCVGSVAIRGPALLLRGGRSDPAGALGAATRRQGAIFKSGRRGLGRPTGRGGGLRLRCTRRLAHRAPATASSSSSRSLRSRMSAADAVAEAAVLRSRWRGLEPQCGASKQRSGACCVSLDWVVDGCAHSSRNSTAAGNSVDAKLLASLAVEAELLATIARGG